ncbi:16S rRNA (cytosine(1402)-N(4))-methyltransferase RsmH [Candidatus Saccharibacteria bacterium]|jgi:16S rRNA (cytosine1402-N4)-methyltransferase|nr:16S rRNA (cytosine(1402)-N(4))-methyltransferase RsmH [Candidatus Saccharibacteria bacterium]
MSIKEHPPQLSTSKKYELHVPVMLGATVDLLRPKLGERYLDLTAGYGGHAEAFLAVTKNFSGATLVDRDENAIAKLESFKSKGATLLHADFVSAAKKLITDCQTFDVIVVDLGVSSPQLDQSERGFSFMKDGPLDMRMDPSQTVSAATVVNTYSPDRLAEIIIRYGEERPQFAKRIAAEICKRRPLSTTGELAELIMHLHRGKWQKTHPATRTFQALRIEVNQELAQVEAILPLLPSLLHQNGRVGVISFHSLEDRLVKRFFKEQSEAGYEAELKLLNRKPLDGATYDVHNPRSRSAKLRGAVKNKQGRG